MIVATVAALAGEMAPTYIGHLANSGEDLATYALSSFAYNTLCNSTQ